MAPGEDAPKRDKDQKNKSYLGGGRLNNPLGNPCMKEQDLSMKCLYENPGDKDACEVYFVNYKNCRAFWNIIIRERRAAGVIPYLPLPEDRDEIKAKRFNSRL